jgi:hypothetical protein
MQIMSLTEEKVIEL